LPLLRRRFGGAFGSDDVGIAGGMDVGVASLGDIAAGSLASGSGVRDGTSISGGVEIGSGASAASAVVGLDLGVRIGGDTGFSSWRV
jgi:hypothetical protein